ncbi:hypothetical protein BE17_17460 [Sorangium cellulosum]|uniref:Uncharacterized protein n=1 Tax=Sorangium cellulosum TaxID=56 RepID=A0A150SC32_SORCE|nr:hypothetical protein BE17_17460 [Sorangium cellulosum]
MWAERVLASVWRSASAGHLQTEACLEAAIVAALEDPEVLRRLADHLHWSLPEGDPRISTQEVVAEGRTDVTLTWPKASSSEPVYQLVLELKANAPPNQGQVEKYLRDGADVVGVARFQRPANIVVPGGGRFLGIVTWRRIRDFWREGAPLPLRQLHHLLDATGVTMPNITLPGMTSLVSSWTAWGIFREWSLRAAAEVAGDLKKAGHTWVLRSGNKGKRGFDERYERYAARLWPPPMRGDWLYLFVGLFVGRDNDPVSVEGVPDLFLALHVDPDKSMGQLLQKDAKLAAAVAKWKKRSGNVLREFRPGEWEVLRARTSALELVQSAEQETEFLAWMRARAKEWVDDGILAIVAKADAATRKTIGEASEPED